MRDALILFWAAGLALGAEYDAREVLRRATEKVLASAREIPNYTCVETVSRDYLEPAAVSLPRACSVLLAQRQFPTPDLVLSLYSTDRLRLDVTMTRKGEIYSWSGASRFDDATVDHVVRSGPFGTGSFGGFLAVVFETDVKKFNFERRITAGGRTLMEYSNCREFRGESTVNFSPDSAPATNEREKGASAKAPSLPIGLTFSIELTASISTDTAAAGDAFSAKLTAAFRDAKGKVLAPKGALVEGHLLRVQSYFRPPEAVVVLKPEALWVRGTRVPLSVDRDWRRVMAEGRKKGKKSLEILLPLQGEENSGAFRFQGGHVRVPAGFRSEWRTVLAHESMR